MLEDTTYYSHLSSHGVLRFPGLDYVRLVPEGNGTVEHR